MELQKTAALSAFILLCLVFPKAYGEETTGCVPPLLTISKPVSISKHAKQDYLENEIGTRGFIGDKIESDPKKLEAAKRNGLLEWRQEYVVVSSKEEAEAHLAQEENVLLWPVYIISHGKMLEDVFNQKASTVPLNEVQNYFRKLTEDPQLEMYEPDPNMDLSAYHEGDKVGFKIEETLDAIKSVVKPGEAIRTPLTNVEMRAAQVLKYSRRDASPPSGVKLVLIDKSKLKDILDYTKVTLADDTRRSEVFSDGALGRARKNFFQDGYASPRYRGVLLRADFIKSKSVKELVRILRKGERLGYAYTINGNLNESLALLSKQDRTSPHILTGEAIERDATTNRFAPEKLAKNQKMWAERVAKKEAYSVEIWSPAHPVSGKRILIATCLGENVGELSVPDTLGYNRTFADAVELEANPGKIDKDWEAKLSKMSPEVKAAGKLEMAKYRQFVREVAADTIEKDREQKIAERQKKKQFNGEIKLLEPKEVFLKIKAIDYAKLSLAIVVLRVEENKIFLLDTQMITHTSAIMAAKYVPREFFERFAGILSQLPPVSFVTRTFWHPKTVEK